MPALLTQRMPIISMNCHRFTPPPKGGSKGTPLPPNGGEHPPPQKGEAPTPQKGEQIIKLINNKIINNKTIKTKTSFAFYTGKSTKVAFPGRCFITLKEERIYEDERYV